MTETKEAYATNSTDNKRLAIDAINRTRARLNAAKDRINSGDYHGAWDHLDSARSHASNAMWCVNQQR